MVAGPRRLDGRGVREGVLGEVVLVVGSRRLHALVAGWQWLPGLQGCWEFTLFGELRLFVFGSAILRSGLLLVGSEVSSFTPVHL